MTADDFRKEALAIAGASEGSHMAHPDFRIRGKIFATLGHPDVNWAMVKLTPEQQGAFMQEAPEVFAPANGAWGRQGSTKVLLTAARKPVVRRALTAAANNITGESLRPAGFNP